MLANKRTFTMIEKTRAVHLIESYDDQDRKYLKVPRLKYLVVKNMGPSTKKMGPNININ